METISEIHRQPVCLKNVSIKYDRCGILSRICRSIFGTVSHLCPTSGWVKVDVGKLTNDWHLPFEEKQTFCVYPYQVGVLWWKYDSCIDFCTSHWDFFYWPHGHADFYWPGIKFTALGPAVTANFEPYASNKQIAEKNDENGELLFVKAAFLPFFLLNFTI